MDRIPFTLPDVGLREIKGTVHLDNSFLVIELENALLGEFDRDVTTIQIQPEALEEVRLQARVLRDRLVLRPESRELLDAIPGKHARDVALLVWRRHRRNLRRLVSAVKMRML